MIQKMTFVKIMDGLRDYWDKVRELEDNLGVIFEYNYLMTILDNTLDAICDEIEDSIEFPTEEGAPWCLYFAYDLDWGRADKALEGAKVNDVTYPLKTAGQLYDFLMMLHEREKLYRDDKLVY